MASNNVERRPGRLSLGILYNNASTPNQERIIAGIEEYAKAANINLLCFDAGICNESGNGENIKNLFCNLVSKRTIDGLIILPEALSAFKTKSDRQVYQRFLPLPLVTVGFSVPGIPCVVADCKKGMQALVKHLVSVHGRKRIGFICGPAGHPLTARRLEDFKSALEHCGIPFNDKRIIEGNFRIDSGREAAARFFGGEKPACDAVVAATDCMAAGMLEELIKRGIRVSADCAITGFQDDEIAEYALLPLTTVKVPFQEMGGKAAAILTDAVHGGKFPTKTTLSTRLVVRESCGCLPSPHPPLDDKKDISLRCPATPDKPPYRERVAMLMDLHSEFRKDDRPLLENGIRRVLEAVTRIQREKDSTPFLAAWNALLELLVSLHYDLKSWTQTLSVLRLQTIAQYRDLIERDKIEDVFLQAMIVTIGKINRLSNLEKCVFQQQSLILRNIEENLLTSFSLEQIKEVIRSDFPLLGISSCFFSLWDGKETPLHYSALAVAYDRDKEPDLKKMSRPFITNRLLPGGIGFFKKRTTLFVEALAHGNNLTGVFLFSIEKPHLPTHDIVRKCLKNAFANALRTQEANHLRKNLESQISKQAKDLLEMNQKLHKEKRGSEKLIEELASSEVRYKKWFEDDFTGNFIAAANGDITNCNAAFAGIFGFQSAADALGANFGDFYPNKSALEDFYTLLGVVKRLEYYEAEFIRKDGSAVHVIGNIIGSFDDDNNLVEMQGFLFDNTEQKRLEEELRQAHKMDAIGRLAGGIAHDFNNILTGIMGYSELLLNKIPKSDPSQRDVEEIKKAAKSAASLTRQLLAFSRKQILKPLLLDLNEVVRTMRDLLIRIIGEHITLITELDMELATVKADRGQIEQVIMNLVINSRDALPQGGTIVLTTRNKVIDSTIEFISNIDIKPGNYAILEVCDNGIGMDLETQSHIFEPFFTTKKPGQGVGLGLSTVYGITTQSGGFPEVMSEPHRGTTMRIYLPQYTSTVETREEPLQYQDEVKGTETILLVEDEDLVRELAEKVLIRGGYHVIAAHNAQEALSFIKKHSLTFDLVVTDIVMPGISGIELGQKIQAMRPEIKVLYMSGYDDRMLAVQGQYPTHVNFIPKPFTPELFLRKVQDVLNQ